MMKKFTDYQLYMLEKAEIKCSDVEKLYGDYVDGDLPMSLAGRIDSHVEDCKECKSFVAGYNQVIQLAKELGPKSMSKDVQNRLRQKLNERLGLNIPTV